MSATTHRSLARLPLEIFEGLQQQHHLPCNIQNNDGNTVDHCPAEEETEQRSPRTPTELRREIVAKLKATTQPKTFINRYSIPSTKERQCIENGATGNATTSQTTTRGIQTVGTFLQRMTPWSLVRALDPLLTFGECKELYRRICQITAPKATTALALLRQTVDTSKNDNNRQGTLATKDDERATDAADGDAIPIRRHWPTGWTLLDESLRGGLRVGTVTEVVGPAGTGKTQLALQLAVTSIAQCGGGGILIDAEQKMSLPRLSEIATSQQGTQTNSNRNNDWQSVLQHISVHSPGSIQDLSRVLNSLEDEILSRNALAAAVSIAGSGSIDTHDTSYNNISQALPVRWLVLDSIAAPVRRSMSGTAATQAATVLMFAQILKRLADQYQLVVFIINQVGTIFSASSTIMNNNRLKNEPSHNGNNNPCSRALSSVSSIASSSVTRAALGTAWHHCVSTRIELHQQEDHPHSTFNPNPTSRFALIVKSNVVGPSETPLFFQITSRGLENVIENITPSNSRDL